MARDPWAPRKGIRMSREQAEALKRYRFAVQQEDRYLGSVFVNPIGQRKHEDAVRAAHERCKRLGLGIDHGL
jgi:hypothetical protein